MNWVSFQEVKAVRVMTICGDYIAALIIAVFCNVFKHDQNILYRSIIEFISYISFISCTVHHSIIITNSQGLVCMTDTPYKTHNKWIKRIT